jgi:hypothetical protein
MALSILDGNQSATTLSTILSSGQHITAHTVVSLGTQAITDIVNATSAGLTNTQLRASAVTVGGTVTVGNSLTISSLPAISGTVTANLGIGGASEYQDFVELIDDGTAQAAIGVHIKGQSSSSILGISSSPLAISGTVTANSNVVSISLSAFPLEMISGGDLFKVELSTINEISPPTWLGAGGGNVPISGTVTANTFALQGTAVTTSNFTSTTASTVLANFNATREVLTIFNEGAGNLHICAGATCTTIAYQVRLSAGDYYEVPNHQTTITHSAVFATAGTARVTEVS